MDPNKTLAAIREILYEESEATQEEDLQNLCDLMESLDEWLSNGGFLPADWQGRS